MVWTPLHTVVHQTLRQRQLLVKGQSIVLAFSGGQDSMCLLQILRDLQPKWQWKFAIAHCDHRWPLDSDANAAYVTQLAQHWNLDLYSLMAPQVLKGEAEGRHWRYEVLKDLAESEGVSTVLTAHTASDRAETLIYNLLRGSGMDGLQALAWSRPLSSQVQLVRPLLSVTRQQTGDFCEQLDLPLWQDTMNEDRAYRRNQIRLDLFPLLRQHNPQLDITLARTAEILQAETDYLDREARLCLERAVIRPELLPETMLAALDQDTLQHAPLALQRRALRHWLFVHLKIQPNFDQIEKTVALIQGHHGDRTDPFLLRIVAEVNRPWICLSQLSS